MVQPVTVGLDIAKNVFHAYGVDAQGQNIFSRKLRRGQVEAFFAKLEPCLVGIEACATAHHWARTIAKLGHPRRPHEGGRRRRIQSGWQARADIVL